MKPKVRKPKAKKEERTVSEGLASLVALFPDARINESGTRVVVINQVGD